MNAHARTFAGIALVALVACSAERDATEESIDARDVSADTVADNPSSGTATVQPDERTLTADGWGPLRIGMTRDEVVASAGEDAHPEAVGGPEPEQCDQFRPERAPEGLFVMVEQGILTRITVSRTTDVATPDDIRVGDPGSRVLDAVGDRAEVLPHKYAQQPAKYITVWNDAASPDARRGIRYEIGPDDVVVHIHAGGPSIEYVEGCL